MDNQNFNQNFNQFPAQPPSNGGRGISIASMVLGIVGLVLSCCIPVLPFLCSLIGLILAIVALAKKADGRGMAIAGLICSLIAVIPALLLILGVASLGSLASSMGV